MPLDKNINVPYSKLKTSNILRVRKDNVWRRVTFCLLEPQYHTQNGMGVKPVYKASIVASVWNVRSRHVAWKRKAKAITTRSINSINAAGRHCFTLMQKEGGRFVSTN